MCIPHGKMAGLTVLFTDHEGRPKGKKRMVVHPIFYELAEECTDPFWKYKLIEFSTDRFPKGYRYYSSSGTLLFKRRSKEYKHTVGDLSALKDFMRATTGMISPEEQEELPEPPVDPNAATLTWSQIMKRREYKHYLLKYCEEIRERLGLDAKRFNSLLFAVDDLILTGRISKCVLFDGERIVGIDGLYQDRDGCFRVGTGTGNRNEEAKRDRAKRNENGNRE